MKKLTDKQCSDAGLALVFIALLTALFGSFSWSIPVATALTLLLMIWPRAFAPFGVFWFGLSHALGMVMSKILLSIVFYALVLPIGLVRRMMGADSMQMKQWKAGDGSVFRVRGETVAPSDLEHMF